MRKRIVVGFYDLANSLTILGMLFSLTACFFAFYGNLKPAMVLLIAAGMADLFDGFVARRWQRDETKKTFGIQIDSLADVVSFGVAPLIISLCNGTGAWYALVVYALYLSAVVIRLAYFNTVTAGQNKGYSRGLPVTYLALVMPIVFLVPVPAIHVGMFAAMALLYLLHFKMPKPRGVWYALFPLVAVALIVVWCLV